MGPKRHAQDSEVRKAKGRYSELDEPCCEELLPLCREEQEADRADRRREEEVDRENQRVPIESLVTINVESRLGDKADVVRRAES